jgi:hypothetical protein
VNSIQPVSNTIAVTPRTISAAPVADNPVSQPKAPQIGSSSAADVPSSIAGLALYGAPAATDKDMDATQGGYGIPDQDGDNDGR